MVDADVRDRASVARERRIDVRDVVWNHVFAVNGHAKVLGCNRNEVVLPLDDHLAVRALLNALDPGIPALDYAACSMSLRSIPLCGMTRPLGSLFGRIAASEGAYPAILTTKPDPLVA